MESVHHHRSRIKETSSRYSSPPAPLATTGPKRSASPKRAISTERRKRLSRPGSSPSTPLKDTAVETLLEPGRRVVAGSNKSQKESSLILWPSAMRSLTVAFQSDTLSVPVSKREKPVSHTIDRTLRPSSNLLGQRKSETKQSRAVIKGTKPADLSSENSKPIDVLHSRLVTSKTTRKVNFTDLNDKANKNSTLHRLGSNCAPSRAKTVNASPSGQRQSLISVLSYFADIKKGNNNKAVNHIEDGHHLRLLYNRHLQWQYANARTGVLLHSRQIKAEKLLYNLWCTILDMRDAVVKKRIDLQQLNMKLMLYSLVNSQLSRLNKWAAIERDHTSSLTWVIQDLQASTIRVPVTGRAKGDVQTVKAAVCSAVDVLQEMGSSLLPNVSRVEGTNSLVSQLANLAARGRSMLDECESLLRSTAALQVEEQSLRTHLLQMNQTYEEHGSSVCGY